MTKPCTEIVRYAAGPYRVIEMPDCWYKWEQRFSVWDGNRRIAKQCTEADAVMIVNALYNAPA
jgi:hypothetical protein